MSVMRIPFTNRLQPTAAAEVKAVEKPRAAQLPPVEIPLDDPLYGYCLAAHGAVELEGLKLNSAALRDLRAAGIEVLIPLVNQGELVGMLQLGNRMSDQEYTSNDLHLMSSLAPQAAAALHVAQLAYQQQVEARRRERIDQELRVAGIIQQTLLPKEIPSLEGWAFATHWQPARSVGGDFYDFVQLQDGRLMITIGDVTDKGVPAALVMASTRTILRAAAERLITPGEILRRANDVLHPDMPPKMFVTCLCVVIDPATGQMLYANAGHNASLQRTKDGVIELRARGMPLGLMPGMTYEEKETMLSPEDTVFMYSDGLVEAHNDARVMFGMGQLTHLIDQHPGGESLIAHLRDALFAFTGPAWEQEDDVTFVVIQRKGTKLYRGLPPVPDARIIDEFEAASEIGGERVVMERVAESIGELALPTGRVERIKTAVAEATMNAMEHGNHYRPDLPVHIQVLVQGQSLTIAVSDHGGSQPVPDATLPDLEAKLAGQQSPRGWGLYLIRAMVDDMRVSATADLHTVELIWKLQEA